MARKKKSPVETPDADEVVESPEIESVAEPAPVVKTVKLVALVGIEIKGGAKLSVKAGESFETTPERAAKLVDRLKIARRA